MSKAYVLNNGVVMLYIPAEVRKKAGLKQDTKVLFGIVKSRNEFYFQKNPRAVGRLSRKINRTDTGGTLVTVPRAISDLLGMFHKCEVVFTATRDRVYFKLK